MLNTVALETFKYSFAALDLKRLPVKADTWHTESSLSAQDVGTKKLELVSDGLNVFCRNVQLCQRGSEMADNRVKVGIVETVLDQIGMSIAHVLAAVVVRATERHREKGRLFVALRFHIRGLEEVGDGVVRQDLSIEDVYRGLDCGGAAKGFVQGLS